MKKLGGEEAGLSKAESWYFLEPVTFEVHRREDAQWAVKNDLEKGLIWDRDHGSYSS